MAHLDIIYYKHKRAYILSTDSNSVLKGSSSCIHLFFPDTPLWEGGSWLVSNSLFPVPVAWLGRSLWTPNAPHGTCSHMMNSWTAEAELPPPYLWYGHSPKPGYGKLVCCSIHIMQVRKLIKILWLVRGRYLAWWLKCLHPILESRYNTRPWLPSLASC